MTSPRRSKHGTIADHPRLAAQFDPAANGGLTADQVNVGTNERLWWSCPVAADHRWQATGANRLRGTGCPFCAGQQSSVTNNLLNYPELVAEFDVEANGGLAPAQVVATTTKKVWWRCPVADDHRWQARGADRVAGAGCPACIGRQLSVTNTVAAYPELAAQFDVAANGGRTPDRVIATTNDRLWWVCPVADDHRWRATGNNRVRGGTRCPACAGLQASVTNSLARFPELAAQFDVQANGGRTPDQVVALTMEKLWWACPVADDHRWRAPGDSRVRGSGCPACAGRQVSVTNNLARFPELAAQFDVEANGGRTPEQVVAGTHELLWWACPVAPDHRWRARAQARVAGAGCPACSGRQVSVTNNLARFPEVAAQFDVEANGGRTPDQIVAGTPEKLWWTCPVAPDHRWQASGDSRVRIGSGCPACAGLQVSVTNSLARFPELAAQFDVDANDGLTPEQVVAGTNRKLWWACPVAPDHRWAASGANRLKGRGCPACALVAISIREVRLAAELAAALPGLDVEARRIVMPGSRALEADILDRERRLVVEYDGSYWHAGEVMERRDRDKTARLTEAGYTVIRVREAPLAPITAADVTCSEEDPIHLVAAAVLDRIAALRPDLLAVHEAAVYRRHGRPLGNVDAETRLAELRRRAARTAAELGSDPTLW
ncbi:zinc-ribbon domain-containing protein [Blastococcus tunisiensis]|uniref:Zinc-ribbon domain-containing protein n=1 Tax=Blastococcus tunisiensis TaxID=1798228 RepID=A0A1I2IX67_9ACTN|nr:zinc-ribbon domain-containing protein [Blastococcus sp. DSM 46838]SFF45286.1 Protein of unknown function [Blastococcus sp. DSM 46838]